MIFQDELEEKPEIGNKSPIILKDEKPPLLPPSYNSTNPDGEFESLFHLYVICSFPYLTDHFLSLFFHSKKKRS